jgi:4-diphosphocytidyl-2-C-methyl-D-erythritol kinase
VREISLKAFAKINLGLDVVGVRPDGYHLVKMVMETINLYDRVKIRVSEQPEIRVKSNLGFLPTDKKNIAYQAARLLLDEFGIRQGVDIQLEKHIPVAAGLAGGSSNAAAVLKGVSQLFELGLSKKELMVRGLKLGADVPYCIMGGCAMATGIGEELTPLPSMPKCNILLLKLPFSISTRVVYQELDKLEITNPPNIDELIRGLEEQSLKKVAESMGNVLELVSIPKHPKIQMVKEELLKKGAMGSLMSGSGPTVFGLFDEKEKAVYAKKKIEKLPFKKQMYLV